VHRDQVLAQLRERIVAFAASRYAGDAAEDLAQEVLLVLEEKYAHVESLDQLLPLSLQIVRFKMLGAWRKSTRHGDRSAVSVEDFPLADRAPGPAELLARKELLSRLKQALATLGDRCRHLFRMKLDGLTFPQIQQALSVKSINTVYTWDSRCRKQLLERLGGSWEAPRP
jgi:RNA polymerase sigma-70 factor (ECF subfamily)